MLNKLIIRAKNAFWQLKNKKDGQTLVEYALILALISVVAIAILGLLGRKVSSIFTAVNTAMG